MLPFSHGHRPLAPCVMGRMVLHKLPNMKLKLFLSAALLSAGCAQQGEPSADETSLAHPPETVNESADASISEPMNSGPMKLAEAPKAALVQLQNASKSGPVACVPN